LLLFVGVFGFIGLVLVGIARNGADSHDGTPMLCGNGH